MKDKIDCHAVAKCPASFYLASNGCINTREKINCWDADEGCIYLKCTKTCSKCSVYGKYLKALKNKDY